MKSLAQVAALAALAFATPAIAQPTAITISFADLNLASSAGKATLDRRIAVAVRSICGSPHNLDLAAVSAARECAIEARASAKSQVSLAVERAGAMTRIASAR